MRLLFQSAKKSTQVVSSDVIAKFVAHLSGIDLNEDLIHLSDDGQRIKLSGNELGPCFVLKSVSSTDNIRDVKGEIIPQYTFSSGGNSVLTSKFLDWFKIK
ncbi:MAG: hypothetical protein MUO43_12410 [Desulfobacterales bacterium]|nr:hypothetical protein [Desulfobacterales bacterium]